MLDRLSPNEQRALLELLVHLAKADGRLKDMEREVLEMYADLVQVDRAEIEGDYSLEQLVPQFKTPASRVIALQELFRLSHLDGWFAESEQSEILEVSAMMHVPMELLQKIERWVLDGIEWAERGEEILEDAEAMVAP